MSRLRYREIEFATAERARTVARNIETDALRQGEVVGVPYSFVVAGKTYRGRIYKVDETYWIVSYPRERPPRVWRIEIPHFGICDVDGRYRSANIAILKRSPEEQRKIEAEYDELVRRREELERRIPRLITARLTEEQKRMRRELKLVINRLRILTREMRGIIIRVCLYHAHGIRAGHLKLPMEEVKNKIRPVPDLLCIKFCPQYWDGFCKAYLPAYSKEEEKRKSKTYRGMSIICLEDPWWSRYWRDADIEVYKEARRYWGVE